MVTVLLFMLFDKIPSVIVNMTENNASLFSDMSYINTILCCKL